jgi:hypothetical protein
MKGVQELDMQGPASLSSLAAKAVSPAAAEMLKPHGLFRLRQQGSFFFFICPGGFAARANEFVRASRSAGGNGLFRLRQQGSFFFFG